MFGWTSDLWVSRTLRMNEFKARVEDEQEVLVPCLGERVNSGFVTSSAAQNLSLCALSLIF